MDPRLKRLKFRAWRRGFRELDLILGGFADASIESLDETGLSQFEALLEAPDQEVYAWLCGAAPPPPVFDTPLLARIRGHNQIGGAS